MIMKNLIIQTSGIKIKNMKTSSAKSKGRNLQKYIRSLILASFPLMPDDVRSTGMGQNGVDIQLSPKAREHFNFDVECKNQEKIAIWAAWKQCTENSKYGKPMLFIKRNFSDLLVVMKGQDLFNLLEMLDKFTQEQNLNNEIIDGVKK